MRMDKLTSRFQQALQDAQSLALGRDHSVIEPVHLMTALLDQSGGSTRPLLAQAGVNVPLLRERLGEALEKLPKVSGQAGQISVGNDLARLLNLTDKLAQQNGDQFIAASHFVEEVRRQVQEQYGERALYDGGLSIRSTINTDYQLAAARALRAGLEEYDRRHEWRGPIAQGAQSPERPRAPSGTSRCTIAA